MQFYWDGIYTVRSPSGNMYTGVLGFQGAKPLFRPIVLAQAVSSLPVEPYMMLFENKKFTPEGEGGSGRYASATEDT